MHICEDVIIIVHVFVRRKEGGGGENQLSTDVYGGSSETHSFIEERSLLIR